MRGFEPLLAQPRDDAESLPEGIDLEWVAAGGEDGGIEEHQRRGPSTWRGLVQRRHRREGVEDAGPRLFAEMLADGAKDPVVVPGKSRHVVIPGVTPRVAPVVAQVVENEVEPAREQRPEGIVQVGRQPVAVAEHEPGACRIAVAAQDDGGIILGPCNSGRQRIGEIPGVPHASGVQDGVGWCHFVSR